MKASTLFGILIGLVAIFGAFLMEGGTIDALFLLPAMIIVFGGTFAAGLAGSSWKQMARLPALFWLSVNPPKYDMEAIINQIVAFSTMARRNGILSLENQLNKVKHPFLRKLLEICIDGSDPETLEHMVETEISHITHRHKQNINLFLKMGGYSPTMGIIGTVMMLILTLASAGSDPNLLIRHIASAFIATMWGILMANIVWLPIGDKLRAMHEEEMRILQVMHDGIYAMLLGEIPSVIKSRLVSAFPLSEQQRLMKRPKNGTPFKIPTRKTEAVPGKVPEKQK